MIGNNIKRRGNVWNTLAFITIENVGNYRESVIKILYFLYIYTILTYIRRRRYNCIKKICAYSHSTIVLFTQLHEKCIVRITIAKYYIPKGDKNRTFPHFNIQYETIDRVKHALLCTTFWIHLNPSVKWGN